MNRKRAVVVQIGLTAAVVVCAVALVLYFVTSGGSGDTQAPSSADAKGIRVSSPKLITKPGSSEPKVVLSVYEDFLCPYCRAFEEQFGPTVEKLINSGAIAADYYMVAILDRPQNQNYSSRASAAAYCVAQESTDTFQRFHNALYAQQPSETGTSFPTDAQLTETAREAGASAGDVADCLSSGRFTDSVKGLAKAAGINSTPTVRINGEDYDVSTPEALAATVDELAHR
jgi:protein-disulfide isomerase